MGAYLKVEASMSERCVFLGKTLPPQFNRRQGIALGTGLWPLLFSECKSASDGGDPELGILKPTRSQSDWTQYLLKMFAIEHRSIFASECNL